MFAALIALATTALVALVSFVTVMIVQRHRAPRSPSVLASTALRHPARGVSAALLVLTLSGAGLMVAFASAQTEAVQPRTPLAIVPASPVAVPPQLATLPLD